MNHKKKAEYWMCAMILLATFGSTFLPNRYDVWGYLCLTATGFSTCFMIYHLHKHVTEPTNEKRN